MARAAVLAALLLCPPPASLAQPAPAKPGSTTVGEVVVQGRTPITTPKAFAKAIDTFVREEGRPGPHGQVSRWRQPICPLTAGLTHGFDEFVNKRILEIAARVGAPGPSDCSKTGVNLLVVFTTKPDELMADVARHHEAMLGYHFVGETKSLAAFEPPMKSWYVTVTESNGAKMVDSAYGRFEPDWGASHFPPPMQSEFAFGFIVVDANLLEGRAIGQVADRVAMLALSKPTPHDGCSPLPTILDAMDPKCPTGGSTEALTSYDESFLKALYAYKGSELRGFEREAIRKKMLKEAGPSSPSSTSAAPPPP
jgi:hypothetical protein